MLEALIFDGVSTIGKVTMASTETRTSQTSKLTSKIT